MSKTIPDLIEACGGPYKIAEASKSTADPIGHWAVRKWPTNGIPRTHFELVRRLAKVSVDQIHKANLALGPRRPLRRRTKAEPRQVAAA